MLLEDKVVLELVVISTVLLEDVLLDVCNTSVVLLEDSVLLLELVVMPTVLELLLELVLMPTVLELLLELVLMPIVLELLLEFDWEETLVLLEVDFVTIEEDDEKLENDT